MNRESVKSFFQLCLLLFLFSLLVGCGSGESEEVENGADVVAIVNKEVITREDFKNELKWSKRK